MGTIATHDTSAVVSYAMAHLMIEQNEVIQRFAMSMDGYFEREEYTQHLNQPILLACVNTRHIPPTTPKRSWAIGDIGRGGASWLA